MTWTTICFSERINTSLSFVNESLYCQTKVTSGSIFRIIRVSKLGAIHFLPSLRRFVLVAGNGRRSFRIIHLPLLYKLYANSWIQLSSLYEFYLLYISYSSLAFTHIWITHNVIVCSNAVVFTFVHVLPFTNIDKNSIFILLWFGVLFVFYSHLVFVWFVSWVLLWNTDLSMGLGNFGQAVPTPV